MKIGQITMYGDNYGACLQAYALQKVIEGKGHNIQLISYHQCCKNEKTTLSVINKIQSLGLLGLIKYIRERKYIKLRKNAYKDFRKTYLNFSNNEYYRDDDLKKLNTQFDMFICGSDMIWSEEFVDDWDFYFMKFAEKSKSFSYAPSFGKSSLTDKNITKVYDYLAFFSKISCRENKGVNLINDIGPFKAVQVVDPTLLLTREEWCECIPNKERVIKESFVFSYLFGMETKGRKSFFARVEKEIGKIYSLPKFNKKSQQKFPVNGVGPMDYLRLFRDADFIITDTFHGLMFSLIFRKPFVVLKRNDGSNWSKYSDRMTSTLEMFNLTERYVDDSLTDIKWLKNLDYSKYEMYINERRISSLKYLDEILGGECDR